MFHAVLNNLDQLFVFVVVLPPLDGARLTDIRFGGFAASALLPAFGRSIDWPIKVIEVGVGFAPLILELEGECFAQLFNDDGLLLLSVLVGRMTVVALGGELRRHWLIIDEGWRLSLAFDDRGVVIERIGIGREDRDIDLLPLGVGVGRPQALFLL